MENVNTNKTHFKKYCTIWLRVIFIQVYGIFKHVANRARNTSDTSTVQTNGDVQK